MYTKELFHETVGILVKAYMNGTLAHGDCNACAVGNIIAYRIGADVIPHQESSIPYFSWVRNGNEITPIWPEIFSGGKIMFGAEKRVDSGWYKRQIDASGYHWRDLAKIERAFETCEVRDDIDHLMECCDDQWMFNGLMAVVDVLCEIHGMNETEKQESKALFVKA